MNDFEMINDEALDEVAGGLSFDLGFVSADISLTDGISVESEIGSLSIDSPLTIAGDIVQQATGAISDLLTGFADRLTQLGQLFDFS
ncbi:MAG: hypothetical protein OXT09_21110 [Myxococcales bacterium]|nr:hypothetical protein [Myxococcales bacterium]